MSTTGYTTPATRRLEETFLFLFRVLLGTPALAFLSLVVTVAAWWMFSDPRRVAPELVGRILLTVYAVSLLPALVVIVWSTWRNVCWRVELQGDALLFGLIGRRRRVPCNDVTFVRRGDRLRQAVHASEPMPVRIEFRPREKRTLWLTASDAAQLFADLRQRCAHAASVDADGTQYAPRVDPGETGSRRLSRERLVTGGGWLVLGVSLLAIAIFAGNPVAHGGNAVDAVRRELLRLLGLVQGLGFTSLGLYTLRQRPWLRASLPGTMGRPLKRENKR